MHRLNKAMRRNLAIRCAEGILASDDRFASLRPAFKEKYGILRK